VLSEAAHSANDLIASAIAFVSVRVSDRPADPQHPYGHGKVESLSGLAEALLIFGAAGYIVYESVEKLLAGAGALHALPGVAVMLASVVLNSLVSRYLFRVARDTDSLALEADAEHLRTDVVTSLGVFGGLLLVHLTGWTVLDPIVAIGVALLICHVAFRLSRSALGPLMDAQLPKHDTEVVQRVLEAEPAVKAYHKLRTRKSGSSRYIDAHVLVDDSLTLLQAHELTEALEDRIRRELPGTEIMLHTEPYDAEQWHQHVEHGAPPPDHRKHYGPGGSAC
jgi:cation diffusion facilitator family transporter